jgi:hypothetical protein
LILSKYFLQFNPVGSKIAPKLAQFSNKGYYLSNKTRFAESVNAESPEDLLFHPPLKADWILALSCLPRHSLTERGTTAGGKC